MWCLATVWNPSQYVFSTAGAPWKRAQWASKLRQSRSDVLGMLLTEIFCKCLFNHRVSCHSLGQRPYMTWILMMLRLLTLDPSILAATALGPKHCMPSDSKTSTIPATRGTSGPTTTKLMLDFLANTRRSAGWSGERDGTLIALRTFPVAPFPGAQKMVSTRVDWLSFQARACSLPPPPISSIRRLSFSAMLCVNWCYETEQMIRQSHSLRLGWKWTIKITREWITWGALDHDPQRPFEQLVEHLISNKKRVLIGRHHTITKKHHGDY